MVTSARRSITAFGTQLNEQIRKGEGRQIGEGLREIGERIR